jgi:biotin-[acetyl-CoA-carboxylase] ligase BirA-like protein
MTQKDSAEKAVRDIRGKTRRKFSAEEKIRMMLEGPRGEESIALAIPNAYSWCRSYSTLGTPHVMKAYTDSRKFADLMISGASWSSLDSTGADLAERRLCTAVFGDSPVQVAELHGVQGWQYLFAREDGHRSQYDLLIEQRRQGWQIPHGVLCLTGAGRGLHGLRRRPWAAEAGNIHLSVHLAPDRIVTASGVSFMVLAAISVIDAIDAVPGLEGKAGIKWVNDILLGGAKVAGVLAYTEGAGKSVDSAVLGIGLNVETTPVVEGTPFVPSVSSLRDHVSDAATCTQSGLFDALLAALSHNYQLLLDGKAGELVDRYRERSVVVGKEVTVCLDDDSAPLRKIATGRVRRIGDNLELLLDGSDEPVTRGRLIVDSEL